MEWGFWEVVVGAIALLFAVGWALYERHKNRKRLHVVLGESVQLVAPHAGARGLTVSLDDRRLKDPHVSSVRIGNEGRVPIETRDFDTGLEVQLSGGEVVSVAPGRLSPGDLRVETTLTGNTVRVGPMLLNSSDNFELVVVSDGAIKEHRVSGRISGVSRIELRDRHRIWGTRFMIVAELIVLLTVLVFMFGRRFGVDVDPVIALAFVIGTTAISGVYIWTLVIKDRELQR